MKYGLPFNKPVSEYRCQHCEAGAWSTYPRIIDPSHLRIAYVHVRHAKGCPLGDKKEREWGMPRVL